MIAIDVVIFAALFAYKISFHYPNHEYLHLLVTYHFGFAKRALIGSILSLFVAKVPVSAVYILGLAAWLAAAGLFILAFRRIFSFDRRNIPLFAFMFGSPLFLKNFMYSIGYFDIYGCIVGFAALLIPIGPIYPFVIGAACVLLILVHHLHFLLYIPTICLIAFVRYYWLSDRSPLKAACGASLRADIRDDLHRRGVFRRRSGAARNADRLYAATCNRRDHPRWRIDVVRDDPRGACGDERGVFPKRVANTDLSGGDCAAFSGHRVVPGR